MKFAYGLALVILAVSSACHGKERVYFIVIVEENWDYAPSMRNEITGENITEDSPGAQYVLPGPERIGSVYKKALYRQFTDDTYTTRSARPDWLGLLGPMLYGEVGDVILIHAKNMASREYSLHPHGVFYLKDSEGAVYEDKTQPKDKMDERIPPGGSYTYRWVVNERAGPAEGGPNCLPWLYHSHVDSPYDTNTGLIGVMLLCRAGILDDNDRRTDVEEDFVLLFTVLDENLSYYLDDNIARLSNPPEDFDPENEDFLESNRKDGVNGYLFGNIPGLDMCHGDRVAWHLIGMGTEIDVHTVNFHGNVLENRNHRVDTFSMTPAATLTGNMMAFNPGTWLVESHVVTHSTAGAQALYTVSPDCSSGVTDPPLTGQTREYFIGIVEQDWEYGPMGQNLYDRTSLSDPDSPAYPFFQTSNATIPGVYRKAIYVGYTDDTFTVSIDQPDHLGILGPVIRAEVGDTIRVTLNNSGSRPYSIHPRGVIYDKANEGMTYNDGTGTNEQMDGAVQPGTTYVYTWTVPESVGPTDRDQQCITWLYSSATDDVRDMYTGLIGPLLVCKKGALNDEGQQVNVDREFILLFMIFDENLSWLIDINRGLNSITVPSDDETFVAANQRTTINGRSFANLAGLDMNLGDRISWHVTSLGKDIDQHTAYFHQSTFLIEGRRVDSVPLFPGIGHSFVTVPDNPGTWLIECQTNTHFTNGMTALYAVQDVATAENVAEDSQLNGQVREYFIAAEEVEWDYTPDKYDYIRSQSLTDEDSPGYVFVNRGNTTIGSRYRKAIYRQFTDDKFLTQVKRESVEDMSLGILGPVIHAEVGDTIRVIFANMATRPYSMHPQNLVYNKSSEGATYDDPTTSDSPVQPGQQRTYIWTVPASRGPSDTDPACIASVYYSSVSRVEDTNSGLVGPLMICRQGTLGADGRRTDVDKEFHLFFSVLNENLSWYLRQNIDHYCLTPSAVDTSDPDFQESNLMHGINGLLYTNLRHLDMMVGERVAWNLIGLGDEVDLHSVHFHGHTAVYETEQSNRLDVSELFPGTFIVLEMTPDDPGIWLLHCHVNDHILGGMETLYTVLEEGSVTTMTTSPTGKATSVAVSKAIAGLLVFFSLAFLL